MRVIFVLVFSTWMFNLAVSENESVQVYQSNQKFGNSLYRALSGEDSNIGFSPISLHVALFMAYQGALGTTAQALSQVLEIDGPEIAARGYHEIIRDLNNIDNITLNMADKIYLMEGSVILNDFQRTLTRDFYSEIQQVNFERNVEAADIINAWVEEETHGKIQDLVESEDFDAYTRLVLINALYFKAQWAYRFNTSGLETFYLNEKERVDVEMMRLDLDETMVPRLLGTRFIPEIGARVLEIPYTNQDLNMVILLPADYFGLKEMEEKLANYDLGSVTDDLMYETAIVYLPRFKIEQTIDLEETLTQLGLGEIFDEYKANFRGMIELADGQHLWVAKVLQKVFIEVNEEGSEAAAATEVVIVTDSADTEFKANHPFVFLITQKSTKDVVFYGRIINP